MSPAASRRRRSRASLVAALALAFLLLRRRSASRGGYRSCPGCRSHQLGAGSGRAQPDRQARRTALLTQFHPTSGRASCSFLGVRRDKSGKPAWYRISLPGRPNGRNRLIPVASVDFSRSARRS